MDIKIYQLSGDFALETIFSYMSSYTPDFIKYQLVYEEETEEEAEIDALLEQLFHRFNQDPPTGYRGTSMSVGDVVVVDGNAYLCRPFGFEKTAWLYAGN